ncbi:MAG: glycosyltransferase, partial [Candidatus Magasanikbacteria bacterium]|nr:glycosyltransferase [Candidatus Magasanikbacteria bacterium]
MNRPKLISIIIPVYNEAKNIPVLHDRLASVLSANPRYDYEIIFINDGSGDGSAERLLSLS